MVFLFQTTTTAKKDSLAVKQDSISIAKDTSSTISKTPVKILPSLKKCVDLAIKNQGADRSNLGTLANSTIDVYISMVISNVALALANDKNYDRLYAAWYFLPHFYDDFAATTLAKNKDGTYTMSMQCEGGPNSVSFKVNANDTVSITSLQLNDAVQKEMLASYQKDLAANKKTK